ncbi:MAG TPA: hypothetical protein VF755_25725, partial [Catenuloplanes sp.]
LLAHGLAAANFAAGHAPAGCPAPSAGCATFASAMGERYRTMEQVLGWLPLVPALIGMFWGAPLLAREAEQGTDKLVWTQSVTRRRWVLTKLGVLGGLVTLGGLALSGMVTAWLRVFRDTGYGDTFGSRGMFSITGVAPAAWWLLFLALGAAAGAAFRRVVPAMAVVVAVFTVTLFGVFVARDFYAAPAQAVKSSSVDERVPGSAILTGSSWLDPQGRPVPLETTAIAARIACPTLSERDSNEECLYGLGYRQRVSFHPPDRFWRFQWVEAGLLLVGTLAMAALVFYRTVRRRT